MATSVSNVPAATENRKQSYVSILAFGAPGSLARIPEGTQTILSRLSDQRTTSTDIKIDCATRFHSLPHFGYDVVLYAPDGLQYRDREVVNAFLEECFDEIAKTATYAIMFSWGSDGLDVIARSGEANDDMPTVSVAIAQIGLENLSEGPSDPLPGRQNFLGYCRGPGIILYDVAQTGPQPVLRTALSLHSAITERFGHVTTDANARDVIVIDVANGIIQNLDGQGLEIPQVASPNF